MTERDSFETEIAENKDAKKVSSEVATVETGASSLDIRLRGAYITDCELTSPTTGQHIDVLYAEEEKTKAKLTATHPMVPAGPFEGLGGQHGFPRWSDYNEFPLADGQDGEKNIAVQAKRSDEGLALVKAFELTEFSLTSHTTIMSSEDTTERTSMGEHLYFSLVDENMEGLTVDGTSLDELIGPGSEEKLKNGDTLRWNFSGETVIHFPAGHDVKLSASFDGETKHPLMLWIWKRTNSPSVCFEPVVGVEHLDDDDTSGVIIAPYASATLSTKIELL